MMGVFYNSGQVCAPVRASSCSSDIYDNFVDHLPTFTQGMTVGDPLDPKTKMGPVVSKEQFDRVKGYLEIGKQEGAKVDDRRRNAGKGKGTSSSRPYLPM